MKKLYFILLIGLLAISCKKPKAEGEESATYNYILKQSPKKKKYNIDNTTDYYIKALFKYIDESGNKYLTFQNNLKNEILMYKMDSSDLHFRLKLDLEGNNGVGRFGGYSIKNFDNIYLTPLGRPELIVVDTTGSIINRISYSKTSSGESLVPSYSLSFPYSPIIFVDKSIYITQEIPNPTFPYSKNPLSIEIQENNNQINLLSIYFPEIHDEKAAFDGIGIEFKYSRCFDGENFIYAPLFDENIYIASKDHKSVKTKNAKSKYIKKKPLLEKRPDDFIQGQKKMCEISMYGSIIYDEFRKVYYRIAYPETTMENKENYLDIWQSGRKNFSIIILDQDFNIIGETLFPDYQYISTSIFVDEDGLFISDNYYRSKDFNENILSFQCLELAKIE